MSREFEAIVRSNVRRPDLLFGDLTAQMACGRTAAEEMIGLFDKYGPDVVRQAMNELLDRAEAQTRRLVARIPDGTYKFTDWLDNDGVDLDRRINITVALTIEGSEIHADFTGTSPQVRGPVQRRAGLCALGGALCGSRGHRSTNPQQRGMLPHDPPDHSREDSSQPPPAGAREQSGGHLEARCRHCDGCLRPSPARAAPGGQTTAIPWWRGLAVSTTERASSSFFPRAVPEAWERVQSWTASTAYTRTPQTRGTSPSRWRRRSRRCGFTTTESAAIRAAPAGTAADAGLKRSTSA